MSREVELTCRCGKVHGRISDAEPGSVNRAVCHCDDCQAFLHWLQRPDLFDAKAGSDVVQVAPAALRFDRGQEQIRCVRLTPKGLFRWYASCCNTPVGNTLRPALPFVGIIVGSLVGGAPAADAAFGPSRGAVFGKYAAGEPPEGSLGIPVRLIAGSFARILGFRLRGKTWPHPFFARDGESPLYPITVLSAAEREQLRPLCGRQPNAAVQ